MVIDHWWLILSHNHLIPFKNWSNSPAGTSRWFSSKQHQAGEDICCEVVIMCLSKRNGMQEETNTLDSMNLHHLGEMRVRIKNPLLDSQPPGKPQIKNSSLPKSAPRLGGWYWGKDPLIIPAISKDDCLMVQKYESILAYCMSSETHRDLLHKCFNKNERPNPTTHLGIPRQLNASGYPWVSLKKSPLKRGKTCCFNAQTLGKAPATWTSSPAGGVFPIAMVTISTHYE